MLATNPHLEKLAWKEEMLRRYAQFTDVTVLKEYSISYLRKAIRVNTLKVTVNEVKKRLSDEWTLERVPWCPLGFWIQHKKGERTDIGNLLEHALGYIYVQDPASMIPPLVLDPKPTETVLDMCAAPGSKTTQIAAMMKDEGVLVANDVTHVRLASLGINLQRMGVTHTVVSQMRGQQLVGEYDKILLDAPCSATGTIRRSASALVDWSIGSLSRITSVQRSLLGRAWRLLKSGGTLVYSTCSLEPEENEGMISWFLDRHDNATLEPIDLDITRASPVIRFDGLTYRDDVRHTLRIHPQDNDCEGFFVAKIKKSF